MGQSSVLANKTDCRMTEATKNTVPVRNLQARKREDEEAKAEEEVKDEEAVRKRKTLTKTGKRRPSGNANRRLRRVMVLRQHQKTKQPLSRSNCLPSWPT